MMQEHTPCTAFEGARKIAAGELAEVAAATKAVIDRGTDEPILLFDDATARQIEVDFRGTVADVRRRLAATPAGAPDEPEAEKPGGPGRPKLGVVAREVTLLPRHWDWLNSQPGGASVALRKLVEQARKANERADTVRLAQETAYRFLSAMAGDFPGFEEAARALFAGTRERFDALTAAWPADVRDYARQLAAGAFPASAEE